MAVYSVEGKLGTGKTKFCVWMAQKALQEGRRVASNVDLKCELLVPNRKKPTYCRIPDKPKAHDLEAMGHGNPDSYDEDRNGVLILDELGTWLNSRSFQDKERMPVIDWLIHARKHGWDVFLIVQDANMIDKQVREALIEYQCRCMNLSKIRIPFVGWMLAALVPKWGYLPRMHTVTARTGYGANAIIAQRWMFKGVELHAAYDTRQIFTSTYDKGAFSYLPPWDHKIPEPPFPRLRAVLRSGGMLLRALLRPGAAGDLRRGRVPASPEEIGGRIPMVEWVMRLPPDRRIYWAKRLQASYSLLGTNRGPK